MAEPGPKSQSISLTGAYSFTDLTSSREKSCLYLLLFKKPRINDVPSVQLCNPLVFFSSVGILTRQHTFANPHYIWIIFQPINMCLSKVEQGTLRTAGCLAERVKHVTCISQAGTPKKNELGSEQCDKPMTHWEMCVMINLVSLQHWQWQSSCHLVLNVIGAELWWQQEKLSQCGEALFMAVKLDSFWRSLLDFSMSYLLALRNSFLA